MSVKEQFRQYLEAERGLSANTVSAYMSDLTIYEGTGNDLTAITRQAVSAFVRQQSALNTHPATIRRHLASIRALAKFQAMCNGTSAAINLEPSPKLPRRLPNILSREQTVKLIEAAEGERDRAILELLYASGLRASELTSLTLDKIDLNRRILTAIGKGNKERMIPFGNKAADAVRAWLKIRAKKGMALFSFPNGKGLTRLDLWKLVKAAWKRSGLHTEVSPHTLRHCFATHMLDGHDAVEIDNKGNVQVFQKSGAADLRTVQHLMGHAYVETTAIYLHTSMKKLKQVHSLLGR